MINMKIKATKALVMQNLLLLAPLLLYGLYKNGYLLYTKKLVSLLMLFKPVFFVIIGVVIKIVVDLIRYHKLTANYELVYLVTLGMIVPYNTNVIIYGVAVVVLYIISIFVNDRIKCNKVCLWYLIILLASYLTSSISFKTPLDIKYAFDYSVIDYLFGKGIGGISSTCIALVFVAYILLVKDYYYKKNIPFAIIGSYLVCTTIYYVITRNTSYILNSDLIFGSVFVATLPKLSPYKEKSQLLFGVLIGVLSFVVSIVLNMNISIYLVTFIVSLLLNVEKRKKSEK